MSRIVRDRADARWLPSRFNFAIFKLFAFARLRSARPEPQPGLALSIERNQSASENFIVAAIVFVVLAAFITSLLATSLPFGTACAVAIPTTAVYINVQVVFIGAVILPFLRKLVRTRPEIAIAVNSAITGALILAAAALLAVSPSPLRHVGTAFLIAVGANALAAVIVFAMGRSIAKAEQRFGAGS